MEKWMKPVSNPKVNQYESWTLPSTLLFSALFRPFSPFTCKTTGGRAQQSGLIPVSSPFLAPLLSLLLVSPLSVSRTRTGPMSLRVRLSYHRTLTHLDRFLTDPGSGGPEHILWGSGGGNLPIKACQSLSLGFNVCRHTA